MNDCDLDSQRSCVPRGWRDILAGLRYQICFVVDFPHRLRPVLKCVLGRLGACDPSSNEYFEKLPWSLWTQEHDLTDHRQIDARPVPNLFPLFLLARLYASRAQDRLKQRENARLLDVFTLVRREFEESNLEDVFDSIQKAVTNFQRLEGPYIGRLKRGLAGSDLRYGTLAFLCSRTQAELYSKATDTMEEPPGLLNYSFGRWPGRADTPKIIASKASAPFGADDVILSNLSELPERYQRLLANSQPGTEIAIPVGTLRKAEAGKSGQDNVGSDRLFACMLSFARFSYEHTDSEGCGQVSAEDVRNLRSVVARNLDYAGAKIDLASCARRMRQELQHLVDRDSEGTLALERVHPIMFRRRRASADTAVGPPQTAEELLRSSRSQVILLAGQAGQGKTTTLRHLAWSLCEFFLPADGDEPSTATELQPFPLFVSAWTCRRGLIRAIAARLTPPGLKTYRDHQCESALSKGSWVILIDGFDDLVDSRRCREDIASLVARNPKLRIAIGTRQGFEPHSVAPAAELHVADNLQSDVDAVAFLKAHGVSTHSAEQQVARLTANGSMQILGNPLLLWGVALLLRRDSDSHIPRVPGALLKKVIDEHFLRKWEDHKERRDQWKEIDVDDVEGSLGNLAYWMIAHDHKPDLAAETVKMACLGFFVEDRRHVPGTLARQARAFATYSSLLLKTASTSFRFRHDVFKYYFAAYHMDVLLRSPENWSCVDQWVEYSKWDIPMHYLVGLASISVQEGCIEVAKKTDVGYACKLFGCAQDLSDKHPLHEHLVQQLMHSYTEGYVDMVADYLASLGTQAAATMLHAVLQRELQYDTNWTGFRLSHLAYALAQCSYAFRKSYEGELDQQYAVLGRSKGGLREFVDYRCVESAIRHYERHMGSPSLSLPHRKGAGWGSEPPSLQHDRDVFHREVCERAEEWKGMLRQEIGNRDLTDATDQSIQAFWVPGEDFATSICRTVGNACEAISEEFLQVHPEGLALFCAVLAKCIACLSPTSQDKIIAELAERLLQSPDLCEMDELYVIHKQLVHDTGRRSKHGARLLSASSR